MFKLILFCSVFLTILSCTKEEKPKPSLQKYLEDTNLMIKVTSKLNEEHDARALHKAILMLQLSRVVTCTDFNEECNYFNEYLSLGLDVSKENEFSAGAQQKLRAKSAEMLKAIEEGKEKLKIN